MTKWVVSNQKSVIVKDWTSLHLIMLFLVLFDFNEMLLLFSLISLMLSLACDNMVAL